MTISETLKIQFYDCYNMLKEIVKVCPIELWSADNHGLAVWNHVIHTLMGCAFWLREDYKVEFNWGFPFPKELGEKLINKDWVEISDGFLTKSEIQDCIEYLDKRLEKFWDNVGDELLVQKLWDGYDFTYLSVISAQMRHIMCHVGMCNAALIENGFDEVEWLANGEN